MKTRSSSVIFLLVVLILSSLACNLSAQPITRKLEFVGVAVLPVESDGSALSVNVTYRPAGAKDVVVVTCYYQSSSGTIPIDPPQETVGKALVEGDFETFFPFSVTQPGDYQAYCTSSDGAQSSTASFHVIEAGVLITEPGDQVSQEGQEDPVVQKFTSPGTLTTYYYPVKYGDHYEPETLVTCKTEMQVTVTIWQSGKARLDAAGSWYTLYTCTADVLDKFEFFDLGSAEPYGAEYTVQLASLRRTGTVGTSGGTISGTITQTLPDGNTAFTLEIGKK